MPRRCHLHLASFLALLLLAVACTSPQRTTRSVAGEVASAAVGKARVALVIGNGAYAHASHLRNPLNDARVMAAKLRELGFDVQLAVDQPKSGLEHELQNFVRKIDGADLALLFYAGHGVQVSGRNYFVPVDARLQNEWDVSYEAVDVQRVLEAMQSEAKIGVLLLDSCRDNPLVNRMTRSSRSVGRGLVRMDAEDGELLIVYATSPDRTAEDGRGDHSPFTTALLHHIGTPGVEVQSMLKRVIRDVQQLTAGAQVPWQSSSLRSDVYLADPGRVEPPSGEVAASTKSTMVQTQGRRPGSPSSSTGPPGMVLIPGGKMQYDDSFDGVRSGVHYVSGAAMRTVTLKPFWIDRTEVSVAEFMQCLDAKRCVDHTDEGFSFSGWDREPCNLHNGNARHPVNCVSWQQASMYCAWAGKRLPTDAEWRLAAYGTDGRKYPWGNLPLGTTDVCLFREDKVTCEVGSSPLDTSPYGVLDMFGNTVEWTKTQSNCCYLFHGRCGFSREEYIVEGGNKSLMSTSDISLRGHYHPRPTVMSGFRCAKDP